MIFSFSRLPTQQIFYLRKKKMLISQFFSSFDIIKIEISSFFFFVLPTDPRKNASRRSEKLEINYVWPFYRQNLIERVQLGYFTKRNTTHYPQSNLSYCLSICLFADLFTNLFTYSPICLHCHWFTNAHHLLIIIYTKLFIVKNNNRTSKYNQDRQTDR